MGKKCSPEVSHVLGLVLLLCILPCLSQSAPSSASATAKPSSFKVKVRGLKKEKDTNAPPKLEGWRMLSNGIIAASSPSGRPPKRNDNYHGRRLLNLYSPSAIIRTGPSTSGQGPKKNDNYHGRRLLSIYSSNAMVGARPSTSGQAPKRNDNYHGRRLLRIEAGASKSKKGGGRGPEPVP